jgi:hypothetical protein
VRQAGGACVFWHIFEISWFCPCPGLSALDSYIVDHRKEHQDQLAESTSALACCVAKGMHEHVFLFTQILLQALWVHGALENTVAPTYIDSVLVI